MNITRHINLWQAAIGNLSRYRMKTLSILIPLFLVMLIASAMTFIKDGFLRDAQLAISIMPDITIQKLVGGRVERTNTALIEKIEKIPNVDRVIPRIWGFVPIEVGENQSAAYTLMGVDLQRTSIPQGMAMSIESGNFLSPDMPDGAVVGKAFAQAFHVQAGQDVVIKDTLGNEDNFDIVGIFSTPVQIYAADMILVSIEKARSFFGYDSDEASDLNVYLDEDFYSDTVAREIMEISAEEELGLRVMTRDVLLEVTQAAYGSRSGIFQIMWLILLITVIILAWTQGISISTDMRREIGILKATGWGISDVIEMKMLEALIIGVIGVLAGLTGGLVYLFLDAPGMKGYFIGWSSIYPEFPIPVHTTGKSVILIMVVGIVPLLVATLIPAWLAGIIEPDEAIRR